AALREALRAGLESVLCPGLGTSCGGMDYSVASFQMAAAYRRVVLGQRLAPESFRDVQRDTESLLAGRTLDEVSHDG
ncbi:MAG: hypothetical protein ACR2RE_04345, partial [Geminicoccaceae bacterium]